MIPKNLQQAKHWLSRAKEWGSPTAGEKLGEVLAEIEASQTDKTKISEEEERKPAEEYVGWWAGR